MDDDSQYWEFCNALKNNESRRTLHSKIPIGVTHLFVGEELTGRKTKYWVEFHHHDEISPRYEFKCDYINFQNYDFSIVDDNIYRLDVSQ